MSKKINIYFSDFFSVDPQIVAEYGAFNVSLINDLPLFIDPFLLFASQKDRYQELHRQIIDYVVFLKKKSQLVLPSGAIRAWFHFPEIKENWLGYSEVGNSGRGLGPQFANSLKRNLTSVFSDFGEETGTKTHLEKLTLVKNGVGKDQISDLTCNLIVGYLAEYTERFAVQYISPSKLGRFAVPKTRFDYGTETWTSDEFTLPRIARQFVLLTPVDMLTKDEAWISHREMAEDFSRIRAAVPNDQLRFQIENYFSSLLPNEPSRKQVEEAIEKVVRRHPELLDIYISIKEGHPRDAQEESIGKVRSAQKLFVRNLTTLVERLTATDFYNKKASSVEESMQRIQRKLPLKVDN